MQYGRIRSVYNMYTVVYGDRNERPEYCLFNEWWSTCEFSIAGMEKARVYDNHLKKFSDHIQKLLTGENQFDYSSLKFNNSDLELYDKLGATEKSIDEAFIDNINTPLILDHIENLISSTNIYMDKNNCINLNVISQIWNYISHVFDVFGLYPTTDNRRNWL